MSEEALAVLENESEPERANDTDSASIPEPERISEMINPPEDDEQELLADETEKAEMTDNPAPTEGEDETHENVPNLPDEETVPENDDNDREAIEEGVTATTEDVETAAAEVKEQNIEEEEAEPEEKKEEEEGVTATTEEIEEAAAEVQFMSEEEAEPEEKKEEEEGVPATTEEVEEAVAEVQIMSEEEAEPEEKQEKEEGVPAITEEVEEAVADIQIMSEEEAEPEEKQEEEVVPAITEEVEEAAAEVQIMSEEEAEPEEKKEEEESLPATPGDVEVFAAGLQNISEEETEPEEMKAEEVVVQPVDDKPVAEVVQQERHDISEKEPEPQKETEEVQVTPPVRDDSTTTEHEIVAVEESVQILTKDGMPSNIIDYKAIMDGGLVLQSYQSASSQSGYSSEDSALGSENMLEISADEDDTLKEFPIKSETDSHHSDSAVSSKLKKKRKTSTKSTPIVSETESHLSDSAKSSKRKKKRKTSTKSTSNPSETESIHSDSAESSKRKKKRKTSTKSTSIPSETESILSDSAKAKHSKRKKRRRRSSKTTIIYCGHPSKEDQEFQSFTSELVSSVNDMKGSPQKGSATRNKSVEQWEDLNKFLDVTSAKVKEKIKFPTESVGNEVQPTSSQYSWCFYKHGEYVQLNDEKNIATRYQGVLKSMVVSEMSMGICRRYKIEIESILKDSKENMAAGVTWTDPMINGNDVIKHKYWASQLADSVIINCSEITLRKGPRKKRNFGSSYGKALGSIDKGSTVEIELDSENCLHLYIDGKEGEVDDVIRRFRFISPCWAVFDVRGKCTSIRIEP